jgi:serine-type D-Ala-D-Ala carboxypeptidase/endopeptidase
VFDGYVGSYEPVPGVIMKITREDTHFFTQLPGQPRFEIFASSPREFFLKAVAASLTFEVDANGRATAAIMHQGGRDIRAPRIE